MPYIAKEKTHKERRKPVQKRSIERVNKILDTAAKLANQDLKLSTHLIAEHAKISVGSVYQFFPDIESVKGALIERVMDKLYDQVFEMLDNRAEVDDLKQFSAEMVNVVNDFYNDFPDVVDIMVSMRHTEEFHQVNDNFNTKLGELWTQYLLRTDYPLPETEIRRQIAVSLDIGDVMTMRIWTAKDDEERKLYLDDWVRFAEFYSSL